MVLKGNVKPLYMGGITDMKGTGAGGSEQKDALAFDGKDVMIGSGGERDREGKGIHSLV
jgi:hypothetical protein